MSQQKSPATAAQPQDAETNSALLDVVADLSYFPLCERDRLRRSDERHCDSILHNLLSGHPISDLLGLMFLVQQRKAELQAEEHQRQLEEMQQRIEAAERSQNALCRERELLQAERDQEKERTQEVIDLFKTRVREITTSKEPSRVLSGAEDKPDPSHLETAPLNWGRSESRPVSPPFYHVVEQGPPGREGVAQQLHPYLPAAITEDSGILSDFGAMRKDRLAQPKEVPAGSRTAPDRGAPNLTVLDPLLTPYLPSPDDNSTLRRDLREENAPHPDETSGTLGALEGNGLPYGEPSRQVGSRNHRPPRSQNGPQSHRGSRHRKPASRGTCTACTDQKPGQGKAQFDRGPGPPDPDPNPLAA